MAAKFQILGVPTSIAVVDDLGEESIVESITPEGPTADVWFQCPYNQRFTVAKGLMGSVVASGRTVVRVPPFRYPPARNLFVTAINRISGIKPWTDSFGWLNYEECRLQAHFSVPTWQALDYSGPDDPSGQPFTTTRFRPHAEVFAPPTGSYYFHTLSGTPPVSESNVGVIRSRVEIAMTRHLMPFIPLDAIMLYDGTANDVEITFADRTFPRGCLLFAGADVEPKGDPSTGERTWDITFNLLGNYNIEWNEFLGPDGEYHFINSKADGTGDPPFAYEDYTPLLMAGTF